MPLIDVCLTPETIHLFDLEGKIAVVTDIFRATSTMTAALANGVKSVIPVSELEQCENYIGTDYIKAAERGGKKVEGFIYGNSPFDYGKDDVKNKVLVMTTTNGTRALNLSKSADEILIGSFLNLKSTMDWLKQTNKDIVVVCAGWKGRFSLEDTLYAGAVVHALSSEFESTSDAAFISNMLYEKALETNLSDYVSNAAHFKRLNSFSNHKDVEYCMKNDEFTFVAGVTNRDNNEITIFQKD